ncbi:hypothetical protein J7M28_01395 [bacterium]|nr:hypothetical protein [bacterium]
MEISARIIVRAALLVLVLSILLLGCGSKEVDLRTPESTLRTYVNAYNSGNRRALLACGRATGLKDAFTIEAFDKDGKITALPVTNIEHQVLSSIPGHTSVTRMVTTSNVTLVVRFTSKVEREYDRTMNVRLQCRRVAYEEEDVWTIL